MPVLQFNSNFFSYSLLLLPEIRLKNQYILQFLSHFEGTVFWRFIGKWAPNLHLIVPITSTVLRAFRGYVIYLSGFPGFGPILPLSLTSTCFYLYRDILPYFVWYVRSRKVFVMWYELRVEKLQGWMTICIKLRWKNKWNDFLLWWYDGSHWLHGYLNISTYAYVVTIP